MRAELQRRILVVRALQLGDLLCAVPALRALRSWQPDAHITLCGLPWAEAFARRFHSYLDDFIVFPGYPGLPESEFNQQGFEQLKRRCATRPYDLIVQLHGSGLLTNRFVRELSGKATAGFYPPERPELALDGGMPWMDRGHEIQRLKWLMMQLGAPDCGDRLEYPFDESEQSEADRLLAQHGISHGQSYICMHPGGRSLTRRWPVERFAEVARKLAADGWPIVLTGAGSEADVVGQLAAELGDQCVNLTGQTTLGTIAAVLDRARLLISNDTGVSHIAAARGTPSVLLVLGSEPARWSPLDADLHFSVSVPVDCRPCSHRVCPIGFPCAFSLSPESVYEAARHALERTETVCT